MLQIPILISTESIFQTLHQRNFLLQQKGGVNHKNPQRVKGIE